MAVEHPGLWLIGDPGWHEERVAADDRQSRSQMRFDVMTLVDFWKNRDLISVQPGKLNPYGKRFLYSHRKLSGCLSVFCIKVWPLKQTTSGWDCCGIKWLLVSEKCRRGIAGLNEEALRRNISHRYFYDMDFSPTPQKKDTWVLQDALTALTQSCWKLGIEAESHLLLVVTLLPGRGVHHKPSV